MTSPSLLLRVLRHETRDHHARAEAALPLTRPDLTREGYVRYLEGAFGLHARLEPRLVEVLAPHAAALALAERQRLALLEADLAALGSPAHALPLAPPLALAGVPEALGALYVLEGSTLGGQVLARRLAPVSGGALRYLRGHGEATGALWRALGEAVHALVPAPDAAYQARAVGAARATFDLFTHWLGEERVRAA